MKKLGETKNFYVYAVTGDEKYMIDEVMGSEIDEELQYYLDATKSAEGKKALYNRWMYDDYEKDKLEAKNDKWIEDQLKVAGRPLYFVIVKPGSTVLAYGRAYFVPVPIGDVEPVVYDTFGNMYQEDRYDMTRYIFGDDCDAVWDLINDCIDEGSADLDAESGKLVGSSKDEDEAYDIFETDPCYYELVYAIEGDNGPEEETVNFYEFNNGLAVYTVATGDYYPDDVESGYDSGYMMEFFDDVEDFTLDSCKKLALKEFPNRDIEEGTPLYLKNTDTGEVIYDARVSESRRRHHRSLKESRRRYRRSLKESRRSYRRRHSR